MRGDGDIVSSWKNKVISAVTNLVPSGLLAEAVQLLLHLRDLRSLLMRRRLFVQSRQR